MLGAAVEGLLKKHAHEREHLVSLLKKEQSERRRLHNVVQDLKGNIRVFCRVRPMSKAEIKANEKHVVTFVDEESMEIENLGKVHPSSFCCC